MSTRPGRAITLLLLTQLWAFSLPASSEPDFTGVWVMDKDRSFSYPAGLEQVTTIVHKDQSLTLSSKLKTAQGEQQVNENWILDGQEKDFTPGGAPPGTTGRGHASWLPGKRGIVITDTRNIPGKEGTVTQLTTRKLTLSTDGSTLTIDYYLDTPRGQFETKRIFSRSKEKNP
jgi:hypothetical protein